jgi:hypothetical protein
MSKLVWDDINSRTYEAGVDRGIIRSKSGLVIPWNGLKSVSEKSEEGGFSETYFDGKKIENRTTRGFFSCEIAGVHLPSQFDENHQILWDAIQEIVGEKRVIGGLYVTSQKKREFDFCYRTKVNEDDYKIHMVWDAVITESSSEVTTVSESIKITDYKWKVYAVPPRVFDYSTFSDPLLSTANFIINSRKAPPEKLEIFERLLYGTEDAFPYFPTQAETLAIFGS